MGAAHTHSGEGGRDDYRETDTAETGKANTFSTSIDAHVIADILDPSSNRFSLMLGGLAAIKHKDRNVSFLSTGFYVCYHQDA